MDDQIKIFDDLIRQVLVLKNCTVDDLTQQDIDFANETAKRISEDLCTAEQK